jgi:hypothetical protein
MMDAVKILLERMDTNPEEFTRHGPWGSIIHEYKDLIPPDEVELLDRKMDEVRVKQFTAAVIEQLMQEKVPTERVRRDGRIRMQSSDHPTDALVYKTKNRYAIKEI